MTRSCGYLNPPCIKSRELFSKDLITPSASVSTVSESVSRFFHRVSSFSNGAFSSSVGIADFACSTASCTAGFSSTLFSTWRGSSASSFSAPSSTFGDDITSTTAPSMSFSSILRSTGIIGANAASSSALAKATSIGAGILLVRVRRTSTGWTCVTRSCGYLKR